MYYSTYPWNGIVTNTLCPTVESNLGRAGKAEPPIAQRTYATKWYLRAQRSLRGLTHLLHMSPYG